ncbi:hypothetical protein CALCODRAFT_481771 [Calocera cornea HHB12733]|uniref:Uncharacterized protein n=1 Tax=Calocera cornea HHB12733 TaxID=1353952 RepID=A0A165HEE2_9BASI|nr:hypothetical protein CALCODRAFT_481771 [Calocera cornea HHB12733]
MKKGVIESPGPPAHDEAQVAKGRDPDIDERYNQTGPRRASGALSGGDVSTDDRNQVEDETATILDSESVSAFVRHQHITPESARLRGLSPAIRLWDSNTARPRSSAATVNLATPKSAGSADLIQSGPRGAFGALSGGELSTDDRTHIEDETASFPDGESVSAFVRHQHITPESARLRGLSHAIRLWDSNTARPRSSEAVVTLATPKSAGSADSDDLSAVNTLSLPTVIAPHSPAPSYRTDADLAEPVSANGLEGVGEVQAEDDLAEQAEGNVEDEEDTEEDKEDAEEGEEDAEEEEDDDEDDEEDDEDADEDEEEPHAQAVEFLPVYCKHDDLPKYAEVLPCRTATPSSLPSPPPSPPRKNNTMPFIPTFHIPTRAEVRAVWDDCRAEVTESAEVLHTSTRRSRTSASHNRGLFSRFKHGKNNINSRLGDFTIPPLRL